MYAQGNPQLLKGGGRRNCEPIANDCFFVWPTRQHHDEANCQIALAWQTDLTQGSHWTFANPMRGQSAMWPLSRAAINAAAR
jgi:hypothetical protein